MGSFGNLEQSLLSAVPPRQRFLDFLAFSEGPGWPLPDGRGTVSVLRLVLDKGFLTACCRAILPACLHGSTAALKEASLAMRCVSAIALLAEAAAAAEAAPQRPPAREVPLILKQIQATMRIDFLEAAAPGQRQGVLGTVLANLYQHGKQLGEYGGLDACLSVLAVLANTHKLTWEHQVGLIAGEAETV